MSALLESLNARGPVLWLEIAPPRGVNAESLLSKLAMVRDQIDAINLADNALGRIKMSGLVFAAMVKARLAMAVVLNVSCRDRNRFALKSDLLGAAALGIDAVVALQGDKLPSDGSAGARAVHDIDTFGLLRVIADLNRGDTGEGKRLLKTLPGLVAGAVANPNRKELEREFDLLRRKAEAGARFVITQPVFEPEGARRFVERARQHDLRVVLGILPVKRESMANYLKQNIKDLSATHPHLDRYTGVAEEEVRRISLEQNLKLMDAVAGEVAGFNIMSGGGPSLAIELAQEWSQRRATAGIQPDREGKHHGSRPGSR
ncbi:MAG: methylenetetrahydrofolate reductase [Candidatus Binataceae bacterium]